MKQFLRKMFENISDHLNPILSFQAVHKSIGFLILLPIMNRLIQKSLDVRSLEYLDLNVLKTYFLYPKSFIFFIIAALLFIIWMSIEYLFYVKCYEIKEQSLSEIFKTIRITLKKQKKSKLIKNFIAYFILFMIIYLVIVHANYTIFALAFNLIRENFMIQIILLIVILLILWWISNYLHLVDFDVAYFNLNKIERKKRHRKTFLQTILFSLCAISLLSLLFYVINYFFAALLYLGRQNINYATVLGIKYILQQLYSGAVFMFVPMFMISFMSTVFEPFKRKEAETIFNTRQKSVPIHKNTKLLTSIVLVIYVLSLYVQSRDFFRLRSVEQPEPVAIAHRGTSLWAPGNSIASITEAIEMEADIIEIDVQVTKDGIPVLFHDAVLNASNTNSEAFGINGLKINEVTYEQLMPLTLSTYFPEGYQEKIMTLKNAMDMMNGKTSAMIEMKTDDHKALDIILQVIKESQFKSDIYVSSFNIDTLKYFKEEMACQTNLLLTAYVGEIDDILMNPYVDAMAFEYSAIQSVLVDKIHEANKKVFVWTLNEDGKIARALAAGVDGVITDLPILVKDNMYNPQKSVFFQIFDVLAK